MANLDRIAFVQFLCWEPAGVDFSLLLVARALTDLFAVDERAVPTAEVAHLDARWINVQLAVMTGDIAVRGVHGQPNVAVFGTADDAPSLCLEDVFLPFDTSLGYGECDSRWIHGAIPF